MLKSLFGILVRSINDKKLPSKQNSEQALNNHHLQSGANATLEG
jgi:hypothetical protein